MTTIDPEVRDLLGRSARHIESVEKTYVGGPTVDGGQLVDEIAQVLAAEAIVDEVGAASVEATCVVCGRPVDPRDAVAIDPAEGRYAHPAHAGEVE